MWEGQIVKYDGGVKIYFWGYYFLIDFTKFLWGGDDRNNEPSFSVCQGDVHTLMKFRTPLKLLKESE